MIKIMQSTGSVTADPGTFQTRQRSELIRQLKKFIMLVKILMITHHIQQTGVNKLLSKIPIDLKNVSEENIDKEILRAGIIAELDAVNLYEQMAALTKNDNIRDVLMDIAKEEKTHIGEFQALLLRFDTQQKEELEAGAEEVEEELSK